MQVLIINIESIMMNMMNFFREVWALMYQTIEAYIL